MLHDRADHQPAGLARGAFGAAGVVLGVAPGVGLAGAGLAGLVGSAVMRFGSVCSGIEAASVAFEPLGWSAAWLAEIEPFPSAVLAHHYPDVPNLGDMTAIPRRVLAGEIEAPDMLCGGTPCQAFSVAGLRESLSDERGNLTLTFVEIADAIDHVRGRRGDEPAIILWENVPGVLSTRDNAFGCFLAGLAGEDEPLEPPGGKWANAGAVYGPARAVAWRTLDAQYFGLAQRRRRVFVVASARDGFDSATVLFEWDGVRRDTAPSRESREVAPTIPARSTAGGGLGADFDCDGGTICVATGQAGAETGADMAPTLNCNDEAPCVAHSLRGEGFDASEDGTGRGQPIVVHGTQDPCVSEHTAFALGCNNGGENALAIAIQAGALRTNPNSGPDGVGVQLDHAYTLQARAEVQCVAVSDVVGAMSAAGATEKKHGFGWGQQDWENGYCQPTPTMQVRRLTPRECERLQGFPDDYTLIPWKAHQEWAKRKGTSANGESFEEFLIRMTGRGLRQPTTHDCPDGPRYKALGNSWAVPCVRWIGRRIQRQIDRKVT
ncbi:MAG: DNA cytosine methyltransferase [Opitutaceae bacterium]|nr:DNA cytosine methyltransferase [Opitutaceae bacterium]